MRSRALASGLALTLACIALVPPVAGAKSRPLCVKMSVVGNRDGGGEPSIAIGGDGAQYVTWPGAGTDFARSTDGGRTWAKGTPADTQSGDDSVNVDQSGAVYLGNLNGFIASPDALQAE